MKIRLSATYPCCGKTVHLPVYRLVPIEIFSRRCPACKKQWEIVRHTLTDTSGLHIDQIDWDRDDGI